MEDFIGKYNGGQIESRLDKVKDMVGATASQAGEDGLVPAPAKGDEGRFLCGDGMWKDVVVKPDYTVFDIVMEIASSDNPSISQENYNKLLEKLPSNAVNIFPVRDNGVYISSIFGGYNVNDDNSIWLYIKQDAGILQNSSIQISIYQNLTVAITSGMNYLIPVNDGIDVFTNLTSGPSGSNTKQLTIHTTGDGTKSLMDDGKYRKLPVYGRNLLLGSGKEVSNSNYNIADYWLTEPISKGTQVTLTIFGELGDDKEMFTIYNSTGAVGSMAQFSKADFVNGKASKTFKWITNIGDAVADNTHMVVFSSPKTGTSTSTIHKIKLEYGDISTEWSPAWEDIPDLEERYAYGVEWDTASSSPDGVRVGNMQLHRELPVQSGMRGVVLDNNGGVYYYHEPTAWKMTFASKDYASMVEIPDHWYKLYIIGTKFRMMLSSIPLPGYKHISKFYIGSSEAQMLRSLGLLMSDKTNSTDTRGGDNTSEWDNTYRSLLGCPVTNLTRDQFRQAARKRGSGWEMYTYNAHKTLFWLFAVEYATLDSQKPFNAQKDANGFAQGGLGPGPTQMTDWTNFNKINPLIPCGYTNEFGNGSGEKAYVVKNASGGTHATLMANRYRGIENPFGHIWKYTDGANIQVTTGDAGLSILWTTDDPSNFGDTSYTGYDKKGNICCTNGYAKKMLLGEDGDIVPTEVGGSSSTYWCDYYYTYTSANRMQVVLVGGLADHGSYAGLAYVDTYNAPSDASRNVGSRLCFFPEFRKTSA
nr:MAG TPA: tail collar fiber protein [Crassvirales sp.]